MKFELKKLCAYLALALGCLEPLACSKTKGDSASTDEAASAAPIQVSGVVRDDTGELSELSGWSIVFTERDTGICRVATLDALGAYQITGFNPARAHTISLLSPSSHLESVLAVTATQAQTVFQFFKLTGSIMPTVVHAGSMLYFADTKPITMQTDVAADSDGDLIPNGMDDVLRLVPSSEKPGLFLAEVDTDQDKIVNSKDPDLDGDGIVSWLDSDDDGDGIIDVFDLDANGDGVADNLSNEGYFGSNYFSEGVEYAVVQVSQQTLEDGSVQTTLVFVAKAREGFAHSAVKIRIPSELVDGAMAVTTDPVTGEQSQTAWDGTLLDDGKNNDDGVGDRIYGRAVRLASGKAPKPNEVFFFKFESTASGVTSATDFPYTIPAVESGSITAAWDPETLTVTVGGDLFIDFATGAQVTDYGWAMHLFNSKGLKTFSSDPIAGSSTQYTLYPSRLEEDETYTAYLVAKSLGKVAGYPAWIIKSVTFNLE
jgi:hypothetical protein